MTETIIDLPGVIAKSDDADFLRELIQDAAQRLMDIEVAAVCGAGHGERSPDRENQRNGYRPRQWGEEDQETVRWTVSPTTGRHDRAQPPEVAPGQLLYELARAPANGGEGADGRDTGSLHRGCLHPRL